MPLLPNQLQVNGWLYGIPWAEVTPGPSGSISRANFSYGQGNNVSRTIWVNWNDTDNAVSAILGTNSFNRGTGNLDRVLPVQHPIYTWLYASAISSIEEVRFNAKGSLFVPPINQPQWVSQYVFSKITIVFTQPRWLMISDTSLDSFYGTTPRQEWQRFISNMAEPVSSVLQRKADSYKYADGPTTPAIKGQPIPTAVNQPQREKEIHLTWRRVPQAGWNSNFGAGPPTNQDIALLTVNDAPFLGFDTGTLLFKSYKLIELESAINPTLLGVNLGASPGLLYDVEMIFGWLDGPLDTKGGFTTYHGWNLLPAPGGVPFRYLATSDGTLPFSNIGGASGNSYVLIQNSSFPNIFKMNP